MESPRFGDGPAWESDPHFRVVTHPNRILAWTCDPRGHVDFVTPPWSAVSGIHAVSLLGFGWHAAIHPLDLPPLTAAMSAAAAAGAAFRQRLRVRRHDGSYLAMVIDGQPRCDDRGRLVGYLATCLDVAEHGDAELELDLAEENLTDLMRNSPLPGLALDRNGRVVFANGALCRGVGRSAEAMLQQSLATAIGAGSYLDARLFPDGRQAVDFPSSFETVLVQPDGSERILNWHAIVLRRVSGEAKGAILLGEDVTQELEAERQLQLTHRVFETAGQAMVITDARGAILSTNQAFSRLTGYTAAEAVGQNPRILQSGRHDRAFYETMWRSLAERDHWQGDIWDRRKDGSVYPKFLSISAIRDEGGHVTHYSGIFYDISERKSIEEKLERLAHYDALTGLANRVLLFDRLEAAASLAHRSGKRIGLLYLDLDRFKEVNDRLGHHVGDELLRAVATRLGACIRRHDTAARLGGDEFVLVLAELDAVDDAVRVADKVLAELSRPHALADTVLAITPSIGIAVFPDHADRVDALPRLADAAMYRAKAEGRGRHALVSPELDGER